jgi:hypothetical protein
VKRITKGIAGGKKCTNTNVHLSDKCTLISQHCTAALILTELIFPCPHTYYTHTHTHTQTHTTFFPLFPPSVCFLALSSVYVREGKKLESIEKSMRRIVEIDD